MGRRSVTWSGVWPDCSGGVATARRLFSGSIGQRAPGRGQRQRRARAAEHDVAGAAAGGVVVGLLEVEDVGARVGIEVLVDDGEPVLARVARGRAQHRHARLARHARARGGHAGGQLGLPGTLVVVPAARGGEREQRERCERGRRVPPHEPQATARPARAASRTASKS